MKKLTLITIILAVMLPIALFSQCADCPEAKAQDSKSVKMEKADKVMLAGYGKVNLLSDGHYFTYDFAKKPKIGTSILKVKVYDKKKKLSDDFVVYAAADMPSMKGAHDTGDVKLRANKKGELLVPVNFVMPGVWEIELKFVNEDNKIITRYFQLKI